MLRLAIGGHSQFRVSDIELQRAGVSYTVDTLREIHQTDPEAELFFLLGADMFNDLPYWKDPQEVCHLAQPLIVARAGCDKFDWKTLSTILDEREIEKIKNSVIHLPSIELSSTDIRDRVASGQSIRYRTPRAVEKYIEQKRLYLPKV